MDQPAGSAVPPSDRGAGSRRPGAQHRHALRVGLAVSVVVHVIGLALYPSVVRMEVRQGPAMIVPAGGVPTLQGMEVVDIVAVDAVDDPERPAAPEEVRPVEGPAVRTGAPQLGEPGTGLVAPGPTAAEQMRPNLQDRRIWAPLDPELVDLTPEQIEELQLRGRIAEWQDSLSEAERAARAGTDWTHTDGQGRKWGVSEGKLHLGDVTLPLPFSFGIPVGRRDEIRRSQWEWDEIERGAATGSTRSSWKERAQAIRERRDREREAQRAKPDTTGGRR